MNDPLAAPRIGWPRQWVPADLRRRLLAAALAAAAVILTLTSIHPSPTMAKPPAAGPPANPLVVGLEADQVAAPVRLIDPAVGGLLHVGARVDVLAAVDSPTGSPDSTPGNGPDNGPNNGRDAARVVAEAVRVLAVPLTAAAGNGSAGGSLVVLAVGRATARALAGAEAGGRLSVVLVPG